ncbi:hypothetical protein WJX77_000947 [Trebouxia sp. C0004]
MATNKKEAFRQYLEAAGVLDTITKILVSLYEEPERPKNASDYIKGLLGGPTPAEYDALKHEKEGLKQQLESTKKQLEDLQAKGASSDAAAPSLEATS